MSGQGLMLELSRQEAGQLRDRVIKLEAALRAIIKHQETVGGSMSQYSMTAHIAEKALADE